MAPEFAEMSKDIAERKRADLCFSPHAVEDIWKKGYPNDTFMDVRNAFFWVVDLLKRQEEYFQFDPLKTIPRKYQLNPREFDYQVFSDWGVYRSSKDMLREGIELLNRYYYDWMTGKYQDNNFLTDEQLRLGLKIIECFGGIFGLRPTMGSYIPDDMRRLLVQRMNDYDQREIDKITSGYRASPLSEKWQQQEALEYLIKEKVSNYPNKWRLEQILSRVRVDEINNHYRMALAYGFSTTDLDKFIKWKVAKVPAAEEDVLIRMMRHLNDKTEPGFSHPDSKYRKDYEKIYKDYHRIMMYYPMYLKFGEEFYLLPDETLEPYSSNVALRIGWQTNELLIFFGLVFCGAARALAQNPVKIPGSHYEQSPKRDMTQRELVDRTAQELSNLPRFHAFTKILQEEKGRQSVEKHKIATFSYFVPLDKLYEKGMFRKLNVCDMTEAFCKPCSEIEDEIAKRQTLWKNGLSSPPAERQEEKKTGTLKMSPADQSFCSDLERRK